jgi:hypothetical protein
MAHDHDEIWMRTLPQPHHVVLCDLYHLRRWLSDAKGRREHYFETVSESPATLQRVLDREPDEHDVLSWMAFVLGKDRSFLPHVCKHGGASQALDPEKWRLVLEAGAGAIVGEYLIAVAEGRV